MIAMRRMWHFTWGYFKNEIREFQVFFWCIVFPLCLYFILSSIFGGDMSGGQSMSFNLAIVKEQQLSARSRMLEGVLNKITQADGPFVGKEYAEIEAALIDLKQGKQDLVLGIYSDITSATLLQNKELVMPQSQETPLRLHYVEARESSLIAANILTGIFNTVNLEFNRRGNPDYTAISTVNNPVSASKTKRKGYRDYIFPGVALMMILSVSLLSSPMGLIYYRVNGTNKRLYTTPIKAIEYFLAHFGKLLLTMLISLFLLYLFAFVFYKVDAVILSPRFVLSLIFAMLVMVSFGLMIASLCRKISTAIVLGQGSMHLMMFMGGLYFPVFALPWSLRWLVYALPTTYLVELSRRCQGFSIAPIPLSCLIIVPALWMLISITVFSLNFSKVMGYE